MVVVIYCQDIVAIETKTHMQHFLSSEICRLLFIFYFIRIISLKKTVNPDECRSGLIVAETLRQKCDKNSGSSVSYCSLGERI